MLAGVTLIILGVWLVVQALAGGLVPRLRRKVTGD